MPALRFCTGVSTPPKESYSRGADHHPALTIFIHLHEIIARRYVHPRHHRRTQLGSRHGSYLGGNWNVVNLILGSWSGVGNLVYLLVGISAVVLLVSHKKDCRILRRRRSEWGCSNKHLRFAQKESRESEILFIADKGTAIQHSKPTAMKGLKNDGLNYSLTPNEEDVCIHCVSVHLADFLVT